MQSIAMKNPVSIKFDDGTQIYASEVDHINVTKLKDGSIIYSIVSRQGAKHPIDEGEVSYFMKQYGFTLQYFSPES